MSLFPVEHPKSDKTSMRHRRATINESSQAYGGFI